MRLKKNAKSGQGPFERAVDEFGNVEYSNVPSTLPQYWPVVLTQQHKIREVHLGWMKDNDNMPYNQATSEQHFLTR